MHSGDGFETLRQGAGEPPRAFDHVGLLRVIRRHLPAARGESFFESSQNFGIAPQSHAERFGNGFAGKVVFGGAKTTAENHNLRAK